MNELVSVIIPVFNCETTVEKAVRSALNQSYGNIELIIVDDCSTDKSVAIIEQIAAVDDRIKLIKLPKNVGVGAARKLALENVSGEYFTVLDADDWYLPDRIKNLLQAVKNLNADLVCDNMRLFDHALGRVVGVTEFGIKNREKSLTGCMLFELDNAFSRQHLGYTKPMVRVSFLKKKKITYNTDYRCGEDFLFLAELVLSGAKSFIIPSADYVYVHRISPSVRTISPNSRAGQGFEDIIKSCDYIGDKYYSVMSFYERSALLMKRKSIIDWIAYQDLLIAIRIKNFRKALQLILRQPHLCVIKFYTVRNRIQDLLMIRKSKWKFI